MSDFDRRKFLQLGTSAATAALCAGSSIYPSLAALAPSGRWRGFNLEDKVKHRNDPYNPQDFEIIGGWGFNFVRLPVQWEWLFDGTNYNQATFADLDKALSYGRQNGVHVNLALMNGPGFCHCHTHDDPLMLGGPEGDNDINQFAAFWQFTAARYASAPASALSFNLVNEPNHTTEQHYMQVIEPAVAAVRKVTPSRPIVIDGLKFGNEPVMAAARLDVIEATRGYLPHQLTRFGVPWAHDWGDANTAPPTWPMDINGVHWDKDYLRRTTIEPWLPLSQSGVHVHVGEWAFFRNTPAEAAYRWAADQLSLWKEAGWSWAHWGFRGGYGPLDSHRTDVTYENFKGHNLDKRLLELLQAN